MSEPITGPAPRVGQSALQRLVAAIEQLGIRVTPIPGGIRSICPNHRGTRENFEAIEIDEPRSLEGLGRLPVGAVLIRCHAYGEIRGPGGCSTKAILEALGLELGDLYPRGGARRVIRPRLRAEAGRPLRPARAVPDAATLDRLAAEAREFAEALTPQALERLANLLGLPGTVLQRFGLGWRPCDERREWYGPVVSPCWTIPERDGRGRIVGIARRYRDGQKRHLPGGRRGLLLAEGWRELPGPIYVPEGFTYTAALIANGYCAVGRPSATGGLDELAELLAGEDRSIVILGENDEHPADDQGPARWPGRDGALQICDGLAQALGRADIEVMLPPDNFKDIRAFLAAEAQKGHQP